MSGKMGLFLPEERKWQTMIIYFDFLIILLQIENSQVVTTLKFYADYQQNVHYFHWILHWKDPFVCIKGKYPYKSVEFWNQVGNVQIVYCILFEYLT